jgi:hypothetical protein
MFIGKGSEKLKKEKFEKLIQKNAISTNLPPPSPTPDSTMGSRLTLEGK